MAELKGNKYGTHRVIEPKGVLTQAAWKVDNDMSKVYSNEIVCDVTSLNIDSASFTQISEACGGDCCECDCARRCIARVRELAGGRICLLAAARVRLLGGAW